MPPRPIVALGREHLAAGAARLLLDTAGGPHPGGTGTRAAAPLVAAVAREVPVVLAGGLDPANVGRGRPGRLPSSASTSRPASSARAIAGERPTKDPLRVALFVKRARAARLDRPNVAGPPDARSTPACSTPTPPAAGARTASSAAATSPRR